MDPVTLALAKRYVNLRMSEPIDIEGLSLWLDASDLATLAITKENGSYYVDRWLDKSGHAHNAIAISPEYRPKTYAETLYGHNVITMDGVSNFLVVPNLKLAEPTTYIIVFKQNTLPKGGNAVIDGVSSDKRAFVANSVLDSPVRGVQISNRPGSLGIDRQKLTDPQILYVTFDGSSSLLGQNGLIYPPYQYNNLVAGEGIDGLTIGSRWNAPADTLNGYIAEIIVYNRRLTEEEQKNIHVYLSNKWGIPLNPGVRWTNYGGLEPPPNVTARGLVSLDVRTGIVLHSRQAGLPVLSRSVMKLLTAVTAIRYIEDLNESVEVIASDNIGTGSSAQLQPGDIVTYEHLLYGALLPSGNDAARVIARTVGQKLDPGLSGDNARERFFVEMWAVANEIGANSVVVRDEAGIGPPSHMTAHDAARVMVEASKSQLLRDVMATPTHTMEITGPNARTYNVNTTNALLGNGYVIGGKTGSGGGYNNFVALWKTPDGHEVVTAVMWSETTETRFSDTQALIEDALAKYEWVGDMPRLK